MKLVFIIGTGRCGSTLLHNILARHSQSSFLSTIEERYHRAKPLAKWANFVCRHEKSPLLERQAHRFQPTEGYALLNREVSSIYSRPMRDLTAQDVTPWMRRQFRNFFESRYEALNCPLLVHKYTGWSRLGFFAEIFPEAKFVHIVRDGRAVANSWLQMPWWEGYQGPNVWQWGNLSEEQNQVWQKSNRSYITLAGLCWSILIRGFIESRLGPERSMTIRHEDFVEDPNTKISQVLDFVGLEYDEDFSKQLGKFNISPSRTTAFEQDLLEEQHAELREVMIPELKAFDYN